MCGRKSNKHFESPLPLPLPTLPARNYFSLRILLSQLASCSQVEAGLQRIFQYSCTFSAREVSRLGASDGFPGHTGPCNGTSRVSQYYGMWSAPK